MSQEPLAGRSGDDSHSVTPADSDEGPTPTRTKIVTGLIGAVIVVAAGWIMLRVSSPPIAPGQQPPAGHYSLSCGWCHSVSPSAPVKDVK